MESIAESHFTLTQSLMQEYACKVIRTGYRVACSIFGGILVLGGCFLPLVSKHRSVTLCIEGAVCVALGIFLLIWSNYAVGRVTGKRSFRLQQATANTPTPQKTVLFFSDHLETTSGNGAHTTLSYADLKRTYRTQHLLILVFRNGLGVMAPLDSFNKGSADTVMQLLVADTPESAHNGSSRP